MIPIDQPTAPCDGCDKDTPVEQLTYCVHREPDGMPDGYNLCPACLSTEDAA